MRHFLSFSSLIFIYSLLGFVTTNPLVGNWSIEEESPIERGVRVQKNLVFSFLENGTGQMSVEFEVANENETRPITFRGFVPFFYEYELDGQRLFCEGTLSINFGQLDLLELSTRHSQELSIEQEQYQSYAKRFQDQITNENFDLDIRIARNGKMTIQRFTPLPQNRIIECMKDILPTIMCE